MIKNGDQRQRNQREKRQPRILMLQCPDGAGIANMGKIDQGKASPIPNRRRVRAKYLVN